MRTRASAGDLGTNQQGCARWAGLCAFNAWDRDLKAHQPLGPTQVESRNLVYPLRTPRHRSACPAASQERDAVIFFGASFGIAAGALGERTIGFAAYCRLTARRRRVGLVVNLAGEHRSLQAGDAWGIGPRWNWVMPWFPKRRRNYRGFKDMHTPEKSQIVTRHNSRRLRRRSPLGEGGLLHPAQLRLGKPSFVARLRIASWQKCNGSRRGLLAPRCFQLCSQRDPLGSAPPAPHVFPPASALREPELRARRLAAISAPRLVGTVPTTASDQGADAKARSDNPRAYGPGR